MILAQCGSCENQLKFPDDWIGKLIQCPNCGSMVELPAIAVAKPIRNSEKRIDVRPREITTESLIDIDVSNEQQTPKKNHGDCENDANQNDANHNDEIERTDTSDEYSVVSPTVANSQSPQPYENGFTPLNQPTADPYTGTPINVTPVPGTSYPAPSGIEAPLGALPTFNQYQANKSVQAQPVQAQPVQAQPVQAQPVQAQPVQAQPVQAQPVQAQPVQAQPVQAQPVQAQPVQAQPVQAQPVPTKPVETAPIDVARSDAQKTSKPPLIKSGVAQKKSIEEHENRQADENPASQKEAVSTSSDTKHPPVSNKPHQSDSLTTTKDDKEEDSLTLLRDSPKSKLHDSGLLDGDQADDTLLLEKRPADDPATATPNTNTSRSQASEKPEKNFTKEAAEQKPNEPVLAAKRIQPQKEKPAENQGAAVPLDSIVKAPPNSKKEFAGQPVQPQPVQAQPVQTQPVQATATPVQNDAGNDALPAIAKAVPIATASPPVIPAQEIAATTPVPSPHPTSPQPTNAKRSQLDKKPKFGEKKTIKLSPGAKKAVLYGSIGTALVVAVLLSLVFIQKMITSGPVRTFEAYKIAVKNNDFSALYDVVDSATRDTFDNYAEAKSKETPVDYSLRGKDKFVAVATKRFESTDAIKQKTIDSKLQLIEKATIVSESVNRNRASIQVRFEENATESITFEKIDGDWKIGVPTFSLLFIEY